jgi:hypothetical protein
MISADGLLKDPGTKNLLEKMILEKSDHLEALKETRKQFLNSNAYENDLKDFAPEFRQMVSDITGEGAEIKLVERDLSNMCYTLEKTNGTKFLNEKWEQDYQHSTRSVKIENVISRFLDLHNFKRNICCPFHPDRKPSFKIYKKTNTFHCFGCGAHGSPIDFVMRFQNCDFKEAVRILSFI